MTLSSRAIAVGLFGLLSISAASAADLYVDVPVAAPVIVDDVAQWDGPYVGIFGGYLAGTFEFEGEGGVVSDTDAPGWLLGVNAGYDHTLDNGIVLGVVADVAWTNTEIDIPFSARIDWVGSLRGRAGYDAGAFLPYLTGGLAVASMTETLDGEDFNNLLVGWTVGGGLEIAATDSLSFDVQYRYSDYGTGDFAGDSDSFRSHQITAGLNWRF
jgi:outer membrane immunogenic protein